MKSVILASLLSCAFAAPLYKCNPETYKCEECKDSTAGCNYLAACEGNCGKFSPADMIGTWRGIDALKGSGPSDFTYGEFDMEVM